jgi:hypothetical protein
MNFKNLILLTSLLSISFFAFSGYAQETKSGNSVVGIPCPGYEFKNGYVTGMKNDEIRVIQRILNLDKRTTVALSGPGSAGSETGTYGIGTREAMKRFQALFIEYVGIANGKFNDKTRTVMNSVCAGPYFTGDKSGGVFGSVGSNTTATTTIPLTIVLTAPTTANFDESFRIYIGGTSAIKYPKPTDFIIDGGNISDVRKLAPNIYTALIVPNSDVKDTITIQVEADKIEELKSKNKNDYASNALYIYVYNPNIANKSTTSTSTLAFPDLPSLDNLGIATAINNAASNTAITPGSISGGGEGGGGNDLMKSLQEVLKGLVQGLASKDFGGKMGGDAACACSGLQTTGVEAALGPSGRYVRTGVPGSGNVTGKYTPPPPVCGQAIVKGKCQRPEADTTGMPVVGTMVPGVTYGGR